MEKKQNNHIFNDEYQFGITQEYNKKNRDRLWDSNKEKARYRDQRFGDKQTYRDPNTGEVLHKSHKAAQNKYHKTHPTTQKNQENGRNMLRK